MAGIPKGYEEVLPDIPSGYQEVSSPEPSPISPVEGASPWAMGEVPSAREMKPYVRAAAQLGVGVPTATFNIPAGAAAGALAGAGVDLLYGDKPEVSEVGTDFGLGMAIPYGAKVVIGAGKGIYGAVKSLKGGAAAEDLYQGALKPSTSLKGKEVKERIGTAFREGIPVSEEGLEKLAGVTKSIQDTVDTAVTGATGDVSKSSIVGNLVQLRDRAISGKLAGYKEYVKGIDSVIEEIATHPTVGDKFTVQQAQAFKKDIYKTIRSSYESAKRTQTPMSQIDSAKVQAYRKVASSLREEIEKIIPEIKTLNDRERRALNLQDSLERAVNRINNWDVIGLSEPLVGVILGGSTAGGKIAGTVAWKILKSPQIRSKLAIALSKKGVQLSPETKQILQLDRTSQTLSGKPISQEYYPPPESNMELGAYGGELSPQSQISQGGVPTVGKYNYPIGEHGSMLIPPEFAGVLPQRASVPPKPMPGSRNLLWQGFGKEGSNPAYSITDEEYLKAVGRKLLTK